MGFTTEQKLAVLRDKLNRLGNSPKNIKCPGVVRKISRQIRNLEKVSE